MQLLPRMMQSQLHRKQQQQINAASSHTSASHEHALNAFLHRPKHRPTAAVPERSPEEHQPARPIPCILLHGSEPPAPLHPPPEAAERLRRQAAVEAVEGGGGLLAQVREAHDVGDPRVEGGGQQPVAPALHGVPEQLREAAAVVLQELREGRLGAPQAPALAGRLPARASGEWGQVLQSVTHEGC
jgi:hypothetical protein